MTRREERTLMILMVTTTIIIIVGIGRLCYSDYADLRRTEIAIAQKEAALKRLTAEFNCLSQTRP